MLFSRVNRKTLAAVSGAVRRLAATPSNSVTVAKSLASVQATAAPCARQAVPLLAVNRRHLHAARALRNGDEITVQLPPVAESISEGEIGGFEKEVGDYVEQDEAVVVIETDKTSVPVNAPQSGVITEFLVEEGDTVPIGADLFKMKPGEAPAGSQKPAASEEKKSEGEESSSAAPAADTTPAPAKEEPKKQESKPAPAPAPKKPAPESAGGVTRVKMTRMRKRTAERLKDSQNTAAMLTTFNEIDMSHIIAFRNKHKDAFLKKHGVKLGFMSAFAKAAAWALEREPAVNAFIDTDNEHIVYNEDINISVAVATPKGLVVPVVRRVQDMTYVDIEREIARLGKKARDGDLAIEDMEGGTFTISNGGVFGSLMGTPIINPPQSAILGMHATFDRPVAIDGKVEIRPMMYVALTYDHRLIDGREAVTFLKSVKEAVEDPRIILLD